LLNRDRCTFKHDELYSQLCSQTSQKEWILAYLHYYLNLSVV
jgi:hypothetical protein